MEAAINGIQQEMGESSKIVFCAWGEKVFLLIKINFNLI